jgi:hypothetical protein
MRPNASATDTPQSDADLDWADALAGRPARRDQPDEQARRDGTALRQALRQWPQTVPAPPIDPNGLERMLQHAQRQGLLQRPAACALCRRMRARWQGLRAWAAARQSSAPIWSGLALASVLALVLLPVLHQQTPEPPTLRQAAEIQQRTDPQPQSRRDALAQQLREAGADVQVYARAGRYGLDAEFSTPPDGDLAQRLAAQGLTLGADGSLRVEFREGSAP